MVLSFILYGNTISNKYALDDEFVTYKNSVASKGFDGLKEIFTTRYTEGSNARSNYGYRPIVKATFAIEHQFFGENPHISHLINLLLYAIGCIVLYKVLVSLLANYNPLFPFLVALLFLAHPVHTEVVASLKNRDQLLSFLGCILMIKYYLKFNADGKIRNLLIMVFFFLLAYFSKADAITFIAVLPLISWFFMKHELKRVAISLGTLITFLGLFFILVKIKLPESVRTLDYYENPLFFTDDIAVKTATAFYSLFFYLKLLIIPHPLVNYYGFDMIPLADWTNLASIFTLVILAAAGCWALMNLKKKQLLSFAILYFFCTISIYSNLAVPVVGIVAERFLFVPSLGFAIVLVYLLFRFFKVPFNSHDTSLIKIPGGFVWTSLVILILWSGKTIARNPAWKDHLTLYITDIVNQERSAKAHDLLASQLVMNAMSEKDQHKRQQMISDAVSYYKKAITIYPDFAAANNSLGSVYCNFYQDYQAGIPYLIKAISKDPEFKQASFNLAFALEKAGRQHESIAEYEKLIRKDSVNFQMAYTNLAQLYNKSGRLEDAIKINTTAISKFSGTDLPYISMGHLFLSKLDTTTAIGWWEKALSVSPGNKTLAMGLAHYFLTHGNPDKAAYYSRIANQ